MIIVIQLLVVGALAAVLSACGGNTSSPVSAGVQSTSPTPTPALGIQADGSCDSYFKEDTRRLEVELKMLDAEASSARDPKLSVDTDYAAFISQIQEVQKSCQDYAQKYFQPGFSCSSIDSNGHVVNVYFDGKIKDCEDAKNFVTDCDNAYLESYHDTQSAAQLLRTYLNEDGTLATVATSDHENYEQSLGQALDRCESFKAQFTTRSCVIAYGSNFEIKGESLARDCEKFKRQNDRRPPRRPLRDGRSKDGNPGGAVNGDGSSGDNSLSPANRADSKTGNRTIAQKIR